MGPGEHLEVRFTRQTEEAKVIPSAIALRKAIVNKTNREAFALQVQALVRRQMGAAMRGVLLAEIGDGYVIPELYVSDSDTSDARPITLSFDFADGTMDAWSALDPAERRDWNSIVLSVRGADHSIQYLQIEGFGRRQYRLERSKLRDAALSDD